MKGVTRSKGSVAIDTVPLPEKVLGMPVEWGKVVRLRGRYYFRSKDRRAIIPTGEFVNTGELNRLVGKDVVAAVSTKYDSSIVAIGTWPTPEKPRIRPYWILCYIPVPDFIRVIRPEIRNILVDKMVTNRIFSKEGADRIKMNMK